MFTNHQGTQWNQRHLFCLMTYIIYLNDPRCIMQLKVKILLMVSFKIQGKISLWDLLKNERRHNTSKNICDQSTKRWRACDSQEARPSGGPAKIELPCGPLGKKEFYNPIKWVVYNLFMCMCEWKHTPRCGLGHMIKIYGAEYSYPWTQYEVKQTV